MSAFFLAAFSFPTVLFTVAVLLFVLYGLLVIAGAAEMEWLDGLVGTETGEGSAGGALEALGIGGVPIAIVGGIAAILGWVISFLAMRVLDTPGFVLGSLVGLAAAAVGLFAGTRAARSLRPIFATAQAPSRREFIGRLCTIRSGSVSASSGRAEIEDGAAGLIVEVRCFRTNDLASGSRALVYDIDDKSGIYHVAPVDASLAEGDPARIARHAGPSAHDHNTSQVTQ